MESHDYICCTTCAANLKGHKHSLPTHSQKAKNTFLFFLFLNTEYTDMGKMNSVIVVNFGIFKFSVYHPGLGCSVIGKDEKLFPLVEKGGGPEHLTHTSQHFIPDMEVLDPDDERTGRFSDFRYGMEGAVSSVKQWHLIQLQHVC